MAHPVGESKLEGLRGDFGRRPNLEFHGPKVISDAKSLAYRKLDDALGLPGGLGVFFSNLAAPVRTDGTA